VVKDYVRLARTRSREVFIPLAHRPGHAQVDFGECIGVIGGVRMKLHVFCFDLPHSDACFLKAYPAETTEAFLDGDVSAFDLFGGVPRSILYDKSRWRGFWATASGCAPEPSPSSSAITFFRTGSVDRAKATTRARSKGW
jgi:transposase